MKNWWTWVRAIETGTAPKTPSLFASLSYKVIIEKSRGEVSLMEQDTIKNVSLQFFFSSLFKIFFFFLTSFYATFVFTVYNVFKFIFCPWKHEKTGLNSCKTGPNPAQISIPVP